MGYAFGLTPALMWFHKGDTSMSIVMIPRHFRSSLFFTSIVLFAVLSAFISTAWAAQYNFYLNNSEQGDNSTSTPSLVVTSDGKVKSEGAQETIINGKGDASALTPSAQSLAQADAASKDEKKFRRWRLGFSYGSVFDEQYWGTYAMESNATHKRDGFGMPEMEGGGVGLVSLGFAFLKDFGVNLYFGGSLRKEIPGLLAGSEFEFTPLHITLLGKEDFLSLGAVAGAMALPIGVNISGARKSPLLRPYLGARVSMKFSEQYGLTASYRKGVGTPFSGMWEAGLALYL